MKDNKALVRDYHPPDFEAVDRLWSDTGMSGAARADDQNTIQDTLKTGGKLLVLEEKESGIIIGTSWLTQDGRRIYLHHFGILPEYQGKGYSRDLLNASLEFARSTGLQIKLEVHKSNEIARKMYQKGGFKYLGDYMVYIIRDYTSIDQR